nr:hypothetical protein [Tanacetum cinerariifolium]
MKTEALAEQDKAAKPVRDLTVYPPNTLVKLVPRVLPTRSQVKINIFALIQHTAKPPVQLTTGPAPTFLTPGQIIPVQVNSAGTPSSTSIDLDAPSPNHSPSSSALQSLCLHQGVTAESTLIDENLFAPVDNDPFINICAPEPTSEASSFGDASSAESTYVTQTLYHLEK